VCIGSGKKYANANVSLASPFIVVPSPVAAESNDVFRKKRRYVHDVKNASQERNMAVSVPRRTPESVLARRCTAGKCLTRMRIMPLMMETVCSGTSCLKATRKAACIAMLPDMVAVLGRNG
jgi:hypothetical protein